MYANIINTWSEIDFLLEFLCTWKQFHSFRLSLRGEMSESVKIHSSRRKVCTIFHIPIDRGRNTSNFALHCHVEYVCWLIRSVGADDDDEDDGDKPLVGSDSVSFFVLPALLSCECFQYEIIVPYQISGT